MYIISPFTPLFFSPSSDEGSRGRYVQTFAETDEILVEVITHCEMRDIKGKVMTVSGNVVIDIDWKVWSMNEFDRLYYYTITNLSHGYYIVEINGMLSEPFLVTSDTRELEHTVLIQYAMRDNRDRKDGVFMIAGQRHFFAFRVPGGFMDDGWTFGVNNEQFVSNMFDVSEIYSREVTQKTFTLGTSMGCPVWFAELLNRIMSCTYVYYDGIRYIRHESSVPEMHQVVEGKKSYVFKISLCEVKDIDYTESANQIQLRRVHNGCRQVHNNKLLLI